MRQCDFLSDVFVAVAVVVAGLYAPIVTTSILSYWIPFTNLKKCDHPLNSLLPRHKDSPEPLRNRFSMNVNAAKRFNNNFFNRLKVTYIVVVTV